MAILVNGGGTPTSNHCDFYQDIERGQRIFTGYDRGVLVADGISAGSTVPNGVACDRDGGNLRDASHRLVMIRRTINGTTGPASVEALRAEIVSRLGQLKNDEPLVLYFTDHGSEDHSVVLWSDHSLPVAELGKLLALVPPSKRVILIHDHCYGGGMFDALVNSDGSPRTNACGFSPAQPDETARTGQSFLRHAEAVLREQKQRGAKRPPSFRDAFEHLSQDPEVMSLPSSTSDVFLEKYWDKNATQARFASVTQKHLLHSCALSPGGVNSLRQLLVRNPALSQSVPIILQRQADRLRAELNRAYRAAGLAANAPYSSVAAALENARSTYRAAEEEEARLDEQLAPVRRAFAILRMGPDYPRYKALYDQADRLAELVDKTGNDAAPSIAAGLRERLIKLRAETKPMELQFRNWQRSGTAENPEFARFVKEGAPGFPRTWPADLLDRYSDADDRGDDVQEELAKIRRLGQAIRRVGALNTIIERGDADAALRYADILACENTPLEAPR